MQDNNYQYNQMNDQQYGYQQQQNYQPFDQGVDMNQQQQQQQQSSWYNPPDQLDYSKVGDMDLYSRAGFVKKVYALLTMELAGTIGITALALYTSFGDILCTSKTTISYIGETYQVETTYLHFTWFYWLCFCFSLVLQISIFCCSHLARKVPVNYLLTLLYIVFYGCMLAGICRAVSLSWPINNEGNNMVWTAWAITFAMVIGLTIYAFTTKDDISMKGAFLFILFPPLIMCIFMSFFIYSSVLYIIICSLFIVIYGFYLIWETQLIIGGKRVQLSVDDYIVGSLMLYGTIVQLFLRILEILMLSRR